MNEEVPEWLKELDGEFTTEKEYTGTTLEDIEKLSEETYELKLKVDKEKAALSELTKVFDQKKNELRKILEAHDKTNYSSKQGKISIVSKKSYKVPKGDQKAEFFEWIKETKGEQVLQDLVTINSQTLNSWMKVEEENALERGDLSFEAPGLGEPSTYEQIRLGK